MAKVLVIDDDPHMLTLAQTWLRTAGHDPLVASNGLQGLREFHSHHPDLVLLDVLMPAMNGWEVCQRIREMCDIPVILMSVKADSSDQIKGLELGADDYLAKPVDFPHLGARIQAVLRRFRASDPHREQSTFHNEELDIDWKSREVHVRGQKVELTPTEFRLLQFLIENRGWVVTHDQILNYVWGPSAMADKSYSKLYVCYLRKKVEQDHVNPKWILTERGVGYRFRG